MEVSPGVEMIAAGWAGSRAAVQICSPSVSAIPPTSEKKT